MRVGFLVSSVSRKAGGLFQSVRGLARAVASTNADVRVFGIRDEQSAVDLQEWQPLAVQTFRPRVRAWGYSNELVPAMLAADLDILSVHGLWKYCSVASHRWHQQTGRPYVIHPHGMLEAWAVRNAMWKKRIAALLYENQNLREAACLRALSEAEAQSIRSYGLSNPVCVIPNAIDLPGLRESNAKTEPAKRKTLLYLGRLHPKKNISNLIRAWNETFNSQQGIGEHWVLAIAGWDQGGYESELKRIATGSSVVFLGPKFGADKTECYRACDAFVLPSLSEGLPMAVLEAWSFAKPVLMTPECNLPEGFEANAALRIGATPEEIAYTDEIVRLVQFALRGAGPGDREAFILHALEGFSAEEIASITDRKLEHVQEAISRARAQLRRAFPSNNPFSRKMAQHTGYSERQLNRVLVAELGAGPLALARAHRAQTARILVETTAMPLSDVAFAAGFASVRQFNDTMRATYAVPPSALRRARRGDAVATGGDVGQSAVQNVATGYFSRMTAAQPGEIAAEGNAHQRTRH